MRSLLPFISHFGLGRAAPFTLNNFLKAFPILQQRFLAHFQRNLAKCSFNSLFQIGNLLFRVHFRLYETHMKKSHGVFDLRPRHV